ncbi:MAG TPA: metallophosphoesterase [Polyangiales bacterium]|nr:metallophosphoesterase [Polyangiales bacterium]
MDGRLHTFVVSDMHLTEAQEIDPRRPLWMAYKRREFFIDEDFAAFLEHIEKKSDGPVELVLNGDIFDFDSVTALPSEDENIDWLERARGLGSEEWKSQFKMKVIIDDHPLWFEALGRFIARGHRAVFVVGNHDVELYWPSVQRMVCEALNAPFPANIGEEEDDEPVVFCNWFYLSEGDTYISHGHQYDPNCVVRDPIDPLVEVHGAPRVRVPFGDLAARYMLNGMGYFNPHQSENYIMSAVSYLRFFFRYMLRTQPLLIWTWFWGAYATLWISLRTHWLHPMRDPLLVDDKVRSIALRSQATPSMVRKLNALHVPSATNNPFRIARELWLDRAFFLLAALFLSWQVVLHINIAWPISPFWVFVPALIFMLPYVAYAASVRPTVFQTPLLNERLADLIFKITGARRVVFGHTHEPKCEQVGPVTLYNGGFWSMAFADPECTIRLGQQTFVWIRPSGEGAAGRTAELCRWETAEETPMRALCVEPVPASQMRPGQALQETERGLA